MEEAHSLNIRSSATMMYGTVETIEQRARHLIKILNLQRKTRGFMAFIPWSLNPIELRYRIKDWFHMLSVVLNY